MLSVKAILAIFTAETMVVLVAGAATLAYLSF
jgi:hypothetical protein